jgi:hypothetical protein
LTVSIDNNVIKKNRRTNLFITPLYLSDLCEVRTNHLCQLTEQKGVNGAGEGANHVPGKNFMVTANLVNSTLFIDWDCTGWLPQKQAVFVLIKTPWGPGLILFSKK